MISDAKLAGHSCGQGQMESRTIRTMLLALEEKRTKLWMMFKRGIVRLEEEQKKKEKLVCAHPGKNTGAGQRSEGAKRSERPQRRRFSEVTCDVLVLQVWPPMFRVLCRVPEHRSSSSGAGWLPGSSDYYRT